MLELSLAERLERCLWDFFWIPEGTHVVDRPEIAYLRSDIPTCMLNAVYRLQCEPSRSSALVHEVSEAHGPASRWIIADRPDRSSISEALDQGGYEPTEELRMVVLPIAEFQAEPSPSFALRTVESLEGLQDMYKVTNEVFQSSHEPTDAGLSLDLRLCTGAEPRVFRVVAYDLATEIPVSAGGINLFPEHDIAMLWAGATLQEFQGRGAYSAVLAARIDWARKRGVRYVGLYAKKDTSAPIVIRRGFRDCGGVHYWERKIDALQAESPWANPFKP